MGGGMGGNGSTTQAHIVCMGNRTGTADADGGISDDIGGDGSSGSDNFGGNTDGNDGGVVVDDDNNCDGFYQRASEIAIGLLMALG